MTLERKDFEEKAAILFDRVYKPIDAILAKSGITLS